MRFLSDTVDTVDVVKKEYVDSQDGIVTTNLSYAINVVSNHVYFWQESYVSKIYDVSATLQDNIGLDTKLASIFGA